MRFDTIPDCLKSLDQWVCIHSDSKVPMMATENRAASSTDKSTWSSFAEAMWAVQAGYYDNIGFVFANNNLVGIDIDTAYDEDGFLLPTAAEIIGLCESYTERSRSGRGFHIIVEGTLPFKGKNNLSGLEIYQTSRYFIMTGDTLLYHDVIPNQDALDVILHKYFAEAPRESKSRNNYRVYSPKWEAPRGRRIKLRPIYPTITPGSRNLCLTSLAGLLHNIGYSPRQIYDELIYANETACDPSLDVGEVQQIVQSVTRYER